MPEQVNDLLHKPLVIINLGLESFAKNMKDQGAEVVQVDWKPPAGGDAEMMDLLDQLF
jgi:hypothetical protein